MVLRLLNVQHFKMLTFLNLFFTLFTAFHFPPISASLNTSPNYSPTLNSTPSHHATNGQGMFPILTDCAIKEALASTAEKARVQPTAETLKMDSASIIPLDLSSSAPATDQTFRTKIEDALRSSKEEGIGQQSKNGVEEEKREQSYQNEKVEAKRYELIQFSARINITLERKLCVDQVVVITLGSWLFSMLSLSKGMTVDKEDCYLTFLCSA